MAIVDDTPGVTRDYREEDTVIQGKAITMIDTAGLEESFDDSMFGRMRAQTERAVESADLLVFIIDGREGVTPLDQHFAAWLRKQKQPKLLAVNKCESSKGDIGIGESYGLGFGQPYPISAEHVHGFADLFEAFLDHIPDGDEYVPEEDDEDDIDFDSLDDIEGDDEFEFEDKGAKIVSQKPIKIAVIGRPNVGKSTLVNALLKEDRVMTGPEAGVTRDAIAIDWTYNERKFKLVDTAGLRRKSRVVNQIEKMSVEDSMRAIRLAQIVVLVLDGTLGIDKQDLMIAAHAIEEGRALAIAINKWDIVEDKEKALADIKDRMELSLSQIKDLPVQTMSALNGRNLGKLMDRLLSLYELWNTRVSTGKMNRWLEALVSHHPPPLVRGRPNKLRYITQINTRPPTFALWCSVPKALPDSYKRYIMNSLRSDFNMPGTPIRVLLRKSKNPYAK